MVTLMGGAGLGAAEAQDSVAGGLQRGVVKDQPVYNGAQQGNTYILS